MVLSSTIIRFDQGAGTSSLPVFNIVVSDLVDGAGQSFLPEQGAPVVYELTSYQVKGQLVNASGEPVILPESDRQLAVIFERTIDDNQVDKELYFTATFDELGNYILPFKLPTGGNWRVDEARQNRALARQVNTHTQFRVAMDKLDLIVMTAT